VHISQNGLHFIEGFEGFSSNAYWDSYGRVWTVGYGETEGVGPHTYVSRADGEGKLRRRLETHYEWAVNELHPSTQNAYDALCSFAWNLGAGIFKGNLRDALMRKDYNRAGAIMLQYDHAGGVRLAGLTRRRRAEVDLLRRGGAPPARAPAPGPPAENLDVLTLDEHRTVNSLIKYAKNPKLHPHGMRVTHDKIVELRKAVWLAAEKGQLTNGGRTKPGWDVSNRAQRYKLLWKYSR
jgi:lysozyme